MVTRGATNIHFEFGRVLLSDRMRIVNVKPSFAEAHIRFSFGMERSTGFNSQLYVYYYSQYLIAAALPVNTITPPQ